MSAYDESLQNVIVDLVRRRTEIDMLISGLQALHGLTDAEPPPSGMTVVRKATIQRASQCLVSDLVPTKGAGRVAKPKRILGHAKAIQGGFPKAGKPDVPTRTMRVGPGGKVSLVQQAQQALREMGGEGDSASLAAKLGIKRKNASLCLCNGTLRGHFIKLGGGRYRVPPNESAPGPHQLEQHGTGWACYRCSESHSLKNQFPAECLSR